jgi:phage-related protein
MILFLVDSTDQEFELDKSFLRSFTISPYARRVNIQPRYSKSGGVVTGDEEVDARDINIGFKNSAEADQAYVDQLNELAGFLLPNNGPFYLEDRGLERRTEVRLISISDEPVEGNVLRMADNNKLALKMLDAHWEDLDEIIISGDSSGVTNNDTISVNNIGPIDSYPVITVTALATVSEFTLSNETLGISCKLGTNNFVTGAVFTIDCINGIITLNDGISEQEASQYLFNGTGFLRLAPGENSISYQSSFGDVLIEIAYRRRFPF